MALTYGGPVPVVCPHCGQRMLLPSETFTNNQKAVVYCESDDCKDPEFVIEPTLSLTVKTFKITEVK